MNNRTLFRAGVASSIVAALCCVTPVLAIVLVAIGLEHPRLQLALRIGMGSVANHPLVGGELTFERQRVLPVETWGAHRCSRSMPG